MDPLSDVLALFKLKTYASGAFLVDAKIGFDFPKHQGIKCYAVGSGSCWLSIEGVPGAVHITPGDCVLLPRGLPFCLAADLCLPRVRFAYELAALKSDDEVLYDGTRGCSILGGHFLLAGSHSEMLLNSLPSIVHLRSESDKETMRWSLDRMRKEFGDPQPGGSLIAQQLAYTMLIQALRLHLQEAADGVGWLFALADPQMRIAIACMHDDPGHPWTLQEFAKRVGVSRTVFAQKFRNKVGITSMEYLTRWRMLLAGDRLKSSDESVSSIAWSLGYETESAFGRVFRRVWGCSPREHRRRPEAGAAVTVSSGKTDHDKPPSTHLR